MHMFVAVPGVYLTAQGIPSISAGACNEDPHSQEDLVKKVPLFESRVSIIAAVCETQAVSTEAHLYCLGKAGSKWAWMKQVGPIRRRMGVFSLSEELSWLGSLAFHKDC